MAIPPTDTSPARPALRLWPGVTAVVLQWLVWGIAPLVVPGAGTVGAIGGLAGGLAVAVWWLFFSRAPWTERAGALALMVVAVLATSLVVHPSIGNGMMGMLLTIYAIPSLSLALVAWALVSRRLPGGLRHASLVAAVLVACGVFTLVRTDGVAGDGRSDFAWRWSETSEERLLSLTRDEPADAAVSGPAVLAPGSAAEPSGPEPPSGAVAQPAPPASSPAPGPTSDATGLAEPGEQPSAAAAEPAGAMSAAGWPGFRGPGRDGVIRGVRIATDWSSSPPAELWRRPVGPGWSSFAVEGDVFYTQEQRGDDEIVACYRVTTGEPVWMHRDAARFWESNAGAGPRGTPTLGGGRVYAMGATGKLNALDARSGAVVWSRNAASDTDTPVPMWGFSSSPVIVDGVVIVAAAGRLIAYDIATGAPRWVRQAGGGSYSSPHLATIDGVVQVLLLTDAGVTSVAPADGRLLWEHAWKGAAIVQPAVTAEGDVLISVGGGAGGLATRRLAVARGPGGWTVGERWTSTGLKPYFNDFVVHKGHAYGFDGSILACIDLDDGRRIWKGGRYGHGQLVLLADDDLLLVLSEEGGLALVAAGPDRFTELARLPALEGKTWNHPVLAGGVLLVRNGQEMAAFRMSLAGR